uniref:TmcB/TmcC TPR repeats domain-containing protein n=1 Tax=Oryza punctata TaxID=4537 RepID=A0A0E0KSQ1_ORYPU
MLLRSSSTPFLHSPFLSPSSASASPSSLQLRRAFSDGHLPSLHPSSDGGGKNNTTGLHTELSFSIYNTFNKMAPPPPPVQEQDDVVEQEEAEKQAPGEPELPLFMARGLGIDRIASGLFTAGGSTVGGGNGGAGRMSAVEEEHAEKVAALDAQYKRMMDEQPGDALFLRNYAQFLHEVKGDARRAEEYYSRAMLADPSDGEIMSQYAKLVWEVHRDQERSLTYFHKSVQAAPHNSNVLAAYASFLWEQEDDDGDLGGAAAQPGQVRQLASVAV